MLLKSITKTVENTLMGVIRIFLIKYCISSWDPKNNFDINGKYPINENQIYVIGLQILLISIGLIDMIQVLIVYSTIRYLDLYFDYVGCALYPQCEFIFRLILQILSVAAPIIGNFKVKALKA